MTAIRIAGEAPLHQRLARMAADAQYDVADERGSDLRCIPDPGALTANGARIFRTGSVPKVFLSNDCRFNCAYCGCRCTRDQPRYDQEPMELARIALAAARQNGRGVFISSAICRSADYTQERIAETVRCLRRTLGYPGYIHAKVMPGADPGLIALTGRYADRLSVNIEVAQSAGYQQIAKQKNRDNILTPMGEISRQIREARGEGRGFATSQTTQLMAGSTQESDRTILTLAQALYRKYRLKRVYYTAFHYEHPAQGYDLPPAVTPAWRTRRLYQADRLLALYGFAPEELATGAQPNLREDLDPKVQWALWNLDRFPLEINRASYEELLRVPGIGIVYARRILQARRWGALSPDGLAHLSIPLTRCAYFVTCGGRYLGGRWLDRPAALARRLADPPPERIEQLSCI